MAPTNPIPERDARDPVDGIAPAVESTPIESEPEEVTIEQVAGAPEAVQDAGQTRRRRLAPYADQFLIWATEERKVGDIPHFTELGGRPIELGSWERDTLKLAQTGKREQVRRPLGLLAESLACQVKIVDLLDRFEHGPMPVPAELPEFLEQVVTDVAVGLALLDELQWDMNKMIGSGQLAEAKCLSRFQSKITQVLSDLKKRIGATELELAERRAQDFLTVDLASAVPDTLKPLPPAPPEPLREDEPEAPGWAAYGDKARETSLPPWIEEAAHAESTPGTETTEDPAGKLKPLLYLLVALLVVYAIVIFPRATESGPPLLNLESFAQVETVEQVFPRPPSLYVRLNGEAWGALTAQQQREQIQEIGRIAGAAGYSGANVRTDDGVTVGQWLKKTGARLVARPAGAS